jgi:hypothetical protein
MVYIIEWFISSGVLWIISLRCPHSMEARQVSSAGDPSHEQAGQYISHAWRDGDTFAGRGRLHHEPRNKVSKASTLLESSSMLGQLLTVIYSYLSVVSLAAYSE